MGVEEDEVLGVGWVFDGWMDAGKRKGEKVVRPGTKQTNY